MTSSEQRSDHQTFPTFTEFYTDVHGYSPYRWQSELAAVVDDDGRWPDHVSAPTGAGKTSTLDIAVWSLAKDIHDHGAAHRRLPLRIFLAVERRLVVDSAYLHAETIAQHIRELGSGDPVREAFSALLPDDWDGPLVGAVSLHGAVAEDRSWLRPVGAQIITCTMTQLASRVLFRAVGASDGMLPVHAALTGTDRLVLVDEPHLVPAAVTMLRETEGLQQAHPNSPLVGSTVVLGATVPAYLTGDRCFTGTLVGDPSPTAQAKIAVRKPARLVESSTPADTLKKLATAALDCWEHRDAYGGDGVLVIVNTVVTAQQLAEALRRKLGRAAPSVQLITSTVRPADRHGIAFSPETLTVSTQTMEVGVDLDACALVTELPSMPALVQRLGRLNRTGTRESLPAVIVAHLRENLPADRAAAAIYGEPQLDATWRALRDATTADPAEPDDASFIPDLTAVPVPGESWEPAPRTSSAEEFLRRLTATRPRADAPWEALAFGPDQRDRATVRVAWRDYLDDLVRCGVHSFETVTLPIREVGAFLAKAPGANGRFAGTDAGYDGRPVTASVHRRARVQRADTWIELATTRDLKPDDIVVIDGKEGGYSAELGWNPVSTAPVKDVSVIAVVRSQRGWFNTGVLLGEERVLEATELGEDLTDEVTEKVRELSAKYGQDTSAQVLVHGRFAAVRPTENAPHSSGRVPLALHSRQVEHAARINGELAGFAAAEQSALALAGLHHDAGKTLPAFQTALGNADGSEPLAKSPRPRTSLGLSGWRHEVASAEGVPEIGHGDLARHLVISHHGWGRPVVQHAGGTVHNGDRYRQAEGIYGPWGTALLETVLRFSDWEASRRPWSKNPDMSWASTGVPSVHSRNDERAVQMPGRDGAAERILSGLRPYSLTSVFAGIGALASCVAQGDTDARLCFTDKSPELLSSQDPRWDQEAWSRIFLAMQVAAGLRDETGAKLSKDSSIQVAKGNKWLDRYRDAALGVAPELLPFLFNAEPAPRSAVKETGRFFSAPVHLRNGNPFEALTGIRSSPVSVDALFDDSVGRLRGKMNAGLDVIADVRFTESIDAPWYSGDLVAWAIAGMLALGMPASSAGVGVSKRLLCLPRVHEWSTLDQIRDLTISAPTTEEYGLWASTASSNSDQVKQWSPQLN
ncbi:type I-U CRISPR-associated helicase/endonuclease Cas3 [uncultured Corynebacterium sp.]|uniref:type I-G CRISPR-associated helicase/endonuclease Cas3g n=1 Tax=uncultured Corynebacterium sp. TaxID=159447 RepID=UPI0025EC24B4|nr:type I-U CRISPR-associated helicase/endonuclease Cas3 [uncultured Corynebacterium sp.]